MIEVKNLIKKYGETLAVDDISFTIDKGRIYGFLGPNGAGKSTTMNIMTGYLATTKGEVRINGYDVLKEPESFKKSVGYLPETPPVYMDMTVVEYLDFAAELKDIPKTERKTQRNVVMGKLKLEPVKNKLISNLSKGYRQRVGLAQAIMGFPETVILDEPMVGLDPQQIIEMRELIRSLAKNHTVILSSHILAEVSELCDYLLIISEGKLVAQGSPEALEKQFVGGDGIDMEARGALEQIKKIISSIYHVKAAEYMAMGEDRYKIKITPEKGFDLREALFYTFASGGCPILAMYERKGTLEDVYLKLTQKGEGFIERNI